MTTVIKVARLNFEKGLSKTIGSKHSKRKPKHSSSAYTFRKKTSAAVFLLMQRPTPHKAGAVLRCPSRPTAGAYDDDDGGGGGTTVRGAASLVANRTAVRAANGAGTVLWGVRVAWGSR